MNEYIAQKNGRYLFSDDLLNLQELALSMTSILGERNFVIKGCQFASGKVSSGLVWIDGKIRKVDETPIQGTIAYISSKDSNIMEYSADETADKTIASIIYGTAVTESKPEKSYISCKLGETFPSLTNDWLPKLRLDDKLIVGDLNYAYTMLNPGGLEVKTEDGLNFSIHKDKNGKLVINTNANFEGSQCSFAQGVIQQILSNEFNTTSTDIHLNLHDNTINSIKADGERIGYMQYNVDHILSSQSILLLDGNSFMIADDKLKKLGIASSGLWLSTPNNYLMKWAPDSLSLLTNVSVHNGSLSIEANNTNESGINDTLKITNSAILHHNQATNGLNSGFIFRDDDIYIRINGIDTKIISIGGLLLNNDNGYITNDNGLTFKDTNLINPVVKGGAFSDITEMTLNTSLDIITGSADSEHLRITGSSILAQGPKSDNYNVGFLFDSNGGLNFKIKGVNYNLSDLNGFLVTNDHPHLIIDKNDTILKDIVLRDSKIDNASEISLTKLIFNTEDKNTPINMYACGKDCLLLDSNFVGSANTNWKPSTLSVRQNAGFASRNTVYISGDVNSGIKMTFYINSEKTITQNIIAIMDEKAKMQAITIDVSHPMSTLAEEINAIDFPIDVLLVNVSGRLLIKLLADLGKICYIVNCQDNSDHGTVYVSSLYGTSDKWTLEGGQARGFIGVKDLFDTQYTTQKKPDELSPRSGIISFAHLDNGQGQE